MPCMWTLASRPRCFAFIRHQHDAIQSHHGHNTQTATIETLAAWAFVNLMLCHVLHCAKSGCCCAGLYDSIPFPCLQEQPIDYASDELLWNSAFQKEILQGLVDLGKSVEEAFDGVPQDIEGVYSNGSFTIVQSRPQVL